MRWPALTSSSCFALRWIDQNEESGVALFCKVGTLKLPVGDQKSFRFFGLEQPAKHSLGLAAIDGFDAEASWVTDVGRKRSDNLFDLICGNPVRDARGIFAKAVKVIVAGQPLARICGPAARATMCGPRQERKTSGEQKAHGKISGDSK